MFTLRQYVTVTVLIEFRSFIQCCGLAWDAPVRYVHSVGLYATLLMLTLKLPD